MKIKLKIVLLLCSIVLYSCIQNDSPKFDCKNISKILNLTEGNFEFNFNTLGYFGDYVNAIKEFRKGKGRDFEVIPFTSDLEFGQITLDTVPKPKGAGYHYDCRSHFRLYLNNSKLNTSWIEGVNCNVENTINHNRQLELSELKRELQMYWQTNGVLENKVDSSYVEELNLLRISDPIKLAVWIDPEKRPISDFKSVLNEICRSYIYQINKISEEIYDQDICSVPEENIEAIKKILPLRISIVSTYID